MPILSLLERTRPAPRLCDKGSVEGNRAMNQAGAVERPVEESGTTRHKRAATLVAICALAYFADGLVFSIVGPFAAAIAQSLALSKAELGPIFSASLAGQCAGLIVIPMLAGRYGQRNMVVLSLASFGVAQALS